MKNLRLAWNNFWFPMASPLSLGICRFLYFSFLLWIFRRDLSAWTDYSEVVWIPHRFLGLFALPHLSKTSLVILDVLFKLSLATSALGIFSRISMASALMFGSLFLEYENNFGYVYHNDALALLVLTVFAASRAGDAFSVDAWLTQKNPPNSPEYGWPIQLVRVLFALLYFSAGISKLRNSGLEWASYTNMSRLLIRHHFSNMPLVDWSLWIAQNPILTRFLAFGTLILEVGAPLALWNRRARIFLIPNLLIMQASIYLLFGLKFFTLMSCYCFWVPWEKIYAMTTAKWAVPKFLDIWWKSIKIPSTMRN